MVAVRRLAAILATDVAGYSRLMGMDEEGTHERLQAHFRDQTLRWRGLDSNLYGAFPVK